MIVLRLGAALLCATWVCGPTGGTLGVLAYLLINGSVGLSRVIKWY